MLSLCLILFGLRFPRFPLATRNRLPRAIILVSLPLISCALGLPGCRGVGLLCPFFASLFLSYALAARHAGAPRQVHPRALCLCLGTMGLRGLFDVAQNFLTRPRLRACSILQITVKQFLNALASRIGALYEGLLDAVSHQLALRLGPSIPHRKICKSTKIASGGCLEVPHLAFVCG